MINWLIQKSIWREFIDNWSLLNNGFDNNSYNNNDYNSWFILFFFLSDDNLAAVTSGWISDPATGMITPKKTGRDTNSDLNIFVNFIIPLPFFCYSLHSYDRAMFNSVVKWHSSELRPFWLPWHIKKNSLGDKIISESHQLGDLCSAVKFVHLTN